MRLIPKNWAEFQHYKDRSPPWIKLHRALLNDRAFMTLPTASKALAPLLWLLASESKSPRGDFDASTEELEFRLRMTAKEIDVGLKALISKGFFLPADSVLADRLQPACPETEGETEKEGEGDPGASAAPPRLKKKTQMPEGFAVSERVQAWAKERGFGKLDQHLEAFKRKVEAKGYTYANWDAAFMEAIREDWAKLRGRTANGAAPPADGGEGEWHETRGGVEKRAAELGMKPWDQCEQFPIYKARVMAAHTTAEATNAVR